MAIWTLDKPPSFFPGAVATERGWINPKTGEVLVAISELNEKAGPADILKCSFDKLTYSQGDPLKILVHFNEAVNVVAGATIEVSSNGESGNFVATAAEQSGVFEVAFDAIVPSETATLSLSEQSILGTITDASGGAECNLAISREAALAAGEREIS